MKPVSSAILRALAACLLVLASVLLALLLAAMPMPAHGGVVGVADSADGARLDIHDDAQICLGTARFALYTAADGRTVPGCWLVSGPFMRIVFLDGDVLELPVGAIRKPTTI